MWWRYGCKNSLKNSNIWRFKNLVQCRQHITMWKNEVQKQSTTFEPYFVFCYISIPCLDVDTNMLAVLSKCPTWQWAQRKKHTLLVCENRLLMRIFESKRNKERMQWSTVFSNYLAAIHCLTNCWSANATHSLFPNLVSLRTFAVLQPNQRLSNIQYTLPSTPSTWQSQKPYISSNHTHTT
jgi:hypothetical protein